MAPETYVGQICHHDHRGGAEAELETRGQPSKKFFHEQVIACMRRDQRHRRAAGSDDGEKIASRPPRHARPQWVSSNSCSGTTIGISSTVRAARTGRKMQNISCRCCSARPIPANQCARAE